MHFSRLPGVSDAAFQSSLPQTCGRAHQRLWQPSNLLRSPPSCSGKPVIEASRPPPPPPAPLSYLCQTSGRALGAVKSKSSFLWQGGGGSESPPPPESLSKIESSDANLVSMEAMVSVLRWFIVFRFLNGIHHSNIKTLFPLMKVKKKSKLF